jgi:hypothetical protein
VSGAEQALQSAVLQALAMAAGVKAALGNPVRVLDRDDPYPAFPYLEVARHTSEPAGTSGVEASEHRIDLVVVSRNDGGQAGAAALAAMRAALATDGLPMEGWRCVLALPVFSDVLNQGRGRWRAILRIRALVEAA